MEFIKVTTITQSMLLEKVERVLQEIWVRGVRHESEGVRRVTGGKS